MRENTGDYALKMVQQVLANKASVSQGIGASIEILGIKEQSRIVELRPSQTEFYIGRDGSCEICIEGESISRRHCVIERRWDGYFVRDLNSKNGLRVNSKVITTEYRLSSDDEILVGNKLLIFDDPVSRVMASVDSVDDDWEAADTTVDGERLGT